jgi:hypothetical protein
MSALKMANSHFVGTVESTLSTIDTAAQHVTSSIKAREWPGGIANTAQSTARNEVRRGNFWRGLDAMGRRLAKVIRLNSHTRPAGEYKNSSRLTVAIVTFLWTGVMALPAFAAEDLNFRKNVGDYWVYLAVMPADFIAGPPAAEPGATPFQPASARDTHHLMVSIFDYRTGRRITDAVVEARVAALGLSGVKKALDNASAAGAPVYAGLFPMLGRGPFRIDVEFRAQGVTGPQHTTFYFTHPSFRPPKQAPARAR